MGGGREHFVCDTIFMKFSKSSLMNNVPLFLMILLGSPHDMKIALNLSIVTVDIAAETGATSNQFEWASTSAKKYSDQEWICIIKM